jgi:hypothetical protein
MINKINDRLQRIANALLLNASFIDNLGLLNGKMGIAIFFYHCARYTGNQIYEHYAGELIDEIYNEINRNTPVDFANGLIGIGWGIEYLVQKGFVEADTDEALKDIDNAIIGATMQAPISIHDQTSLFGFGFYYLARLKNREYDDENLETIKKKQSLIYMMDECERMLTKEKLFDISVPRLTLCQVNSLLWFILQIHRLSLFPVKSNKLINYMADYVSNKMENKLDAIDIRIFCKLINELKNLITDDGLLKRYEKLLLAFSSTVEFSIEEPLVKQYVKSGWSSMLYNISSHVLLNGEAEKAFAFIDSEENWTQWLDKLNKTNMGLDGGLAGLGMALLNERM